MIQTFRYTNPTNPQPLNNQEDVREEPREPQSTSFWSRLNKTTKYILIGSIIVIIILFIFLYFRGSKKQDMPTSDRQVRLPIETVDDIIIEQTVLDGLSGIGENKFIYF